MTLRTGATSKRGFTLLELSMVILIISIIVAISTPKFRSTFQTIQFRNTVYNIVKLMNYARDRAIIERKPFRVRFFEDDSSFCLETVKEEEKEDKKRYYRRKREPEFVVVHGNVGQKLFFPAEVTFDIDEPSRGESVTFYPDGQAQECVIYIEDSRDNVFTITTKGSVGFIKLYPEKKNL
ncbi:prepilin-type N-terminal cleavage/methylation domain-containing protein [bacterium]|nr:prepilin-type N-terminal cleavage/methylation domain-containing protein [bacterium]